MRTVWAVTAALAVMVAWVLLCLVPLYSILGADTALTADGREFSTFWVGLAMVVCLIGAVVGGYLAHYWSGRLSAVAALTTVLLVVGFIDAGFNGWLRVHPDAFGAIPSMLRVGLLMPEPAWYDWMLPLAMASFAWVAGQGRAVETAPSPYRRRRRFHQPGTMVGFGES